MSFPFRSAVHPLKVHPLGNRFISGPVSLGGRNPTESYEERGFWSSFFALDARQSTLSTFNPLHLAASRGHTAVCALLLASGACRAHDLTQPDETLMQCTSALSLALQNRWVSSPLFFAGDETLSSLHVSCLSPFPATSIPYTTFQHAHTPSPIPRITSKRQCAGLLLGCLGGAGLEKLLPCDQLLLPLLEKEEDTLPEVCCVTLCTSRKSACAPPCSHPPVERAFSVCLMCTQPEFHSPSSTDTITAMASGIKMAVKMTTSPHLGHR